MSPEAKKKIYLINLDKSVDRLDKAKQLLSRVNAEFERVPAVYGADLGEETLRQWYDFDRRGVYYKELNAGEVGCYLSHRDVWQKILDEGLDYALVLEDDFRLEARELNSLFESVSEIKRPWYYIKIAAKPKAYDYISQSEVGAMTLVTYRNVPTRTCAQLVSREGARRLLAASETIRRPIDVDLQFWWEKEVWIDGLLPYAFAPDSGAESEIDKLDQRKLRRRRRLQGLFDKAAYQARSRWEAFKLKRRMQRFETGT